MPSRLGLCDNDHLLSNVDNIFYRNVSRFDNLYRKIELSKISNYRKYRIIEIIELSKISNYRKYRTIENMELSKISTFVNSESIEVLKFRNIKNIEFVNFGKYWDLERFLASSFRSGRSGLEGI